MNLVYLISFPEREAKNIFPCYYIGSKIDAIFDGTNIIDSAGKIYTGSVSSSYSDEYFELIKTTKYTVKILAETILDPRKLERFFQLKVKAKSNIKYFNKAYADENTLISAKGYGTYKNVLTGKIVKLSQSEITPDYVGIRKGYKHSSDVKYKISNSMKIHWTDEKKLKLSNKMKLKYLDCSYAKKFSDIMNSESVRSKISKSQKELWNNVERRQRASIQATVRNNLPEFKSKFRKSKARGTWIEHEDELKSLWHAYGKPSYNKFRKIAVANGFNDESYQGAVRSWSNYYVNRKLK